MWFHILSSWFWYHTQVVHCIVAERRFALSCHGIHRIFDVSCCIFDDLWHSNQSIIVNNTEETYESINHLCIKRTILCLALSFLHQGWIPCGGKLWTGATHYSPDTTDETIGVVVMIVIVLIIGIIGIIVIIQITWHNRLDNRSRRNCSNHRHHRRYFDDCNHSHHWSYFDGCNHSNHLTQHTRQ